ncbi:ABC transporter ATP-binding protein [Fodinicola feengrottensis]|uniref:ABC transporter ATP-binding protein n=1 Tax=Fodinicola feengrottensis TaxID=435914 RepID=UPI0024429A8F|nr:ATP-binding cassette domain-containing protein [Fodinicola feengrottensis]
MPSATIEVRDLAKTYPGDVRALAGVSFAVPAGSVFSILGPNGAGKSTAMKILTTLARPGRTPGSAHIGGIDVVRDPQQVRRMIGCVAQRSGVDSSATGRENLTLQGRLHGMSGRKLARRVDELVEQVDLTAAASRVAGNYSGGTKRKLDIAMSLIHRPQVLFLDEPTTGLDPEIRAEIWQQIAALAAIERLTVLLTTHHLEEADRLADRVVILDHGRVVAKGSPSQLKDDLKGDAVQVDLIEPRAVPAAHRALAGLEAIREVTIEGCAVRARVDDAAAAASRWCSRRWPRTVSTPSRSPSRDRPFTMFTCITRAAR